MFTSNRRKGGKERFWRRVVRQWRRSRLSVRAFCRERGLSEPSFYGWRRTIAERDSQALAFVPFWMVPDEKSMSAGRDRLTGWSWSWATAESCALVGL